MNRLFDKKLIILVSVALIAGCNSSAETSRAKAEAANANPLVREEGHLRIPDASPLRQLLKVEACAEQSVQPAIAAPAVVEADPAKLIKVASPVSGRIVQLYKHLGDAVRQGDALFTLDSADVAQAYSDAAKAQAALNLAGRNLDRQKELYTAGISPRKDLDQAESDYAQAASEAGRSRARLSVLGAELGRGDGRHYTLHSPIAGHVIELTGAQGGFWNDTNAPIMTVADLSTVWLAASVQEKDIGSLFVGQRARVALDAYEGTFDGRVRYVGQMLDPDTRTVKVRIAIGNSSGRFRPGMFAKVTFSGKAHKAVVVPVSAVVQSGFNTRVFVETSPWRFEPRICKTGAQLGDKVEIVSGLKAGERVVVKEGVLLND